MFILGTNVVLRNNSQNMYMYMMQRTRASQTCPYSFSSTSRYVLAQRLRNHTMSFPIWGLSSCVRLALVARDSTSEVRSTADSSLWWTNAEGGQRAEILEKLELKTTVHLHVKTTQHLSKSGHLLPYH